MTAIDLKDVIRRALGPSIESTVVAAVSGGPDSMAMFHALCELAGDYAGLRIVAAHYDHRLRRDSDLDADLVRQVADAFDVPLYLDGADIRDEARRLRQSVETVARDHRYDFLLQVADRENTSVIATGHTRDDHVESVMMRILRGADTRGLRGIARRLGFFLRPMLDVTHREAMAYCHAKRVPYALDPSNTDRRFFRNHVRHEVLPSLRRVYPGLDAALIRMADSAQQRYDAAEADFTERIHRWFSIEGDGIWQLSFEAFDGLDEEQGSQLLAHLVEIMHMRDVTNAHYRAMLTKKAVDLPDYHVRREHDGLVFLRGHLEPPTSEEVLPVPGTIHIEGWRIESELVPRVLARHEIKMRDPDVAVIPCGHPLVVRFARPGDRMRPLGMAGTKKLSDLFIDRKVPRRRRATTPLIEVNGEIVWVAGVAVSESIRLSDQARAVCVTVKRDEEEDW